MAAQGMSDADFAAKIDWEGGLFEATHGYGLSATDLADKAGDLHAAMVAYDAWLAAGKAIIARVEACLDDGDH